MAKSDVIRLSIKIKNSREVNSMPILELKNICKKYSLVTGLFSVNQLHANISINLSLNAGKTLAIVGESGSGKSTLAKQIIGIEKPTSGDVFLNGKKLDFDSSEHRKERFREIRMIFQNPYESINPQLRIGETLNHTLKINTRLSSLERRKKIEQTLLLVGLQKSHQYHYAHSFSGGQRQRIAIARAIILQPSIILADEPLSALDVSVQAQIINLLQSLQEKLGISIIFISHDLSVVEHIADDVMVMYQGSVVEEGKVSQIFDEPLHPYTQKLFASTPTYRNRFEHAIQTPVAKIKKVLNKPYCSYVDFCHYREDRCKTSSPEIVQTKQDYRIACFKYE